MHRRDFLKLTGAAALTAGASRFALTDWIAHAGASPTSDLPVIDPSGLGGFEDRLSLRITPIRLEIAKGRTLETIGYDGSSPGPVLRMREGVPTALDVYNDTRNPEIVHLHGHSIAAAVDGTPQEGSPLVHPGRGLRHIFKPGPAGTRWYHSHATAHGDATLALYSGQLGINLVLPKQDPGAYDREVLLITHDWEKFLRQTLDEEEVDGPIFSINGKALGFGEPVRVRRGERVLFRIVNGNAEEDIKFALPGHRFHVVALDGNRVPRPHSVEVLRMGSGERIDAIVEMDNPGIHILGDTRDDVRNRGMGIVVEYAGYSGEPQWLAPQGSDWDYTLFGTQASAPKPDEKIEMVFDRIQEAGEGIWRVNGEPFPKQNKYKLHQGLRYRLAFNNQSDEYHPLHLHRHSFELTRVEGKTTTGILKDTVMIAPNGHVEVDFTADQPGLSLFHCHMQNHMESGFMSLFECA